MKEIKRLPESELEIMQIIWKNPAPVSRMTIEDALQKIHPLAPTTILTLLTRLCEKGFLSLEKDGRTNLYTPLGLSCSREPVFSGQAVRRIGRRIRHGAV